MSWRRLRYALMLHEKPISLSTLTHSPNISNLILIVIGLCFYISSLRLQEQNLSHVSNIHIHCYLPLGSDPPVTEKNRCIDFLWSHKACIWLVCLRMDWGLCPPQQGKLLMPLLIGRERAGRLNRRQGAEDS